MPKLTILTLLLASAAMPSSSFAKGNKDANLARIESRLINLEKAFYVHDNDIKTREPRNSAIERRLIELEEEAAECCNRTKNKAK